MKDIIATFASLVYDDKAMKSTLPSKVYESLKKTIEEGKQLDANVADAVASAMKNWAVERGATHYTHWFQPLTGITAEKHDGFISPTDDGGAILEFSGKELIKGEPDASSFPSGGLRATFEARGYTAWDPTSYAFIKDKTLCIPTAFCSYGGEALDKKTPLLRSMEALNKQALRILRLFGNTSVRYVKPNVGPEQEYFLIDKKVYEKRKDLVYTGRTLFGAKAPKGQQLEDHYFGAIKPRVAAFMEALNKRLWESGVFAKTEHNEVAPAQHELATVYQTANVAADHNQLTMEIMKKVAEEQGLVCLLHEKPFAGVNGSGKHNNWSIATDTGVNLLSPGETPYENAQFLLFLCAVLQAVDDYADLLRLSVATAGNDHRLGANEAPPAIVSVFLGDELTAVLDAIENEKPYLGSGKTMMKLGVDALPEFARDATDRNRTSPFAFTGNKFEFRMVGSADSISCANVMLNTAVAESLRIYADRLEKADDFNLAIHSLIKEVISAHKRIIFNGNGYDESWIKEAERRGLYNFRTTPDCMPRLLAEKNVRMLSYHKVFTPTELKSRCETMLDNYCKTLVIEADVMIELTKREILPAVSAFVNKLTEEYLNKKRISSAFTCTYELQTVERLSALSEQIFKTVRLLEDRKIEAEAIADINEKSAYIRDNVIPSMNALRIAADEAETLTAREYWCFPTYGDILFSV